MRFAWKAAVRTYPFSRGRGRLLNLARRAVTGIVVAKDSSGNRLLLDLDNLIDCMIYFHGSYELEAIEALAAHGRRRGCTHFIDVGANLGVYSLYFARQPNIKELWAFEPDPRNYQQLIANLWVNRMNDRVRVSDVALSSKEGPTTFYVFTPVRKRGDLNFNTGTSSLLKAGSKNHTPIEVQMRRLDQVLSLRGENILIKVDVEGAEPLVVEGAEQLLTSNRCLVMLEIWDHPPDLVEKTTQQMSRLGYQRIPADIGPDNYLFGNNVAVGGG